MKSPFYQVIRGNFVIQDKSPDGDSVRFIADDPELYSYLHRSERINLSPTDNSVQLRFQAIDAPEVHYGKDAQPLGDESRDYLLKLLGFKKIQFSGNKVTSAKPERIAGAILATAVERNGRPVAYTLLEKDVKGLEDGDSINLNAERLRQTLNCQLLEQGFAYLNLYSSVPLIHRKVLQTIAREARSQKLGVWAVDRTPNFTLDDRTSITPPDGQLLYPKLFRRCIDYLKAVDKGFRGNLKEWLLASETTSSSENDSVLLNGKTEVKLSDLILQQNNRIVFQADTIDVVFLER
jgi:endonuclease YncB( thermonuclease family)